MNTTHQPLCDHDQNLAVVRLLIKRALQRDLLFTLGCDTLRAIQRVAGRGGLDRDDWKQMAFELAPLLNGGDAALETEAAIAMLMLADEGTEAEYMPEVVARMGLRLGSVSEELAYRVLNAFDSYPWWPVSKPCPLLVQSAMRRTICSVIPRLDGKSEYLRRAACSWISAIKRDCGLLDSDMAALAAHLTSPDPQVRSTVTFALETYGARAAPYLDKVMVLLDDDRCFEQACKLIASMKTSGRPAEVKLLSLLPRTRHPWDILAALQAIAPAEPDRLMTTFKQLSGCHGLCYRHQWAQILAPYGTRARSLLPDLLDGFDEIVETYAHPDELVGEFADALLAISPEEAPVTFHEILLRLARWDESLTLSKFGEADEVMSRSLEAAAAAAEKVSGAAAVMKKLNEAVYAQESNSRLRMAAFECYYRRTSSEKRAGALKRAACFGDVRLAYRARTLAAGLCRGDYEVMLQLFADALEEQHHYDGSFPVMVRRLAEEFADLPEEQKARARALIGKSIGDESTELSQAARAALLALDAAA